MNLTETFAAIPAETERAHLVVDITRFVPGATEPVTLTFRDLDVKRLYTLPGDSEIVQRMHPDMNDRMATTIALLALAHVAPDPAGQPVLPSYIDLALENKKLFGFVQTKYLKAFPALGNFEAETEAAKNG